MSDPIICDLEPVANIDGPYGEVPVIKLLSVLGKPEAQRPFPAKITPGSLGFILGMKMIRWEITRISTRGRIRGRDL